MKNTALILGIIVLVFCGIIWLKNGGKLVNQPEVNAPVVEQSVNPQTKSVEVRDSTSTYTVEVKYPEFSGLSNSEAQKAANDSLKKQMEEDIASFKKDVADNSVEGFDLPPSAFQVGYEVIYLTDSVASIKLSTYYYIAGMAHPNSFYSAFNYDFKDNKEISLADFFNLGSNYLATLSSMSAEYLKEKLTADGYYIENFVSVGTEPKADNFSTFVFDKDKITLIFNNYQVAPYVAGPQQFEVSYDKVSELNNQSGLIKLIKNI
ncbi:MAG: DUF3298 and DUF4163 domain-containing protein [Candidatus Paceibacterota bacterium]